jgi:hypothetical protein
LSLTLAAAARAGTITVANTNDSGAGSLREALLAAAPGETIVVPAGDYALTSGELTIAKSVTVTGAGAATTIVRSAGPFRVMSVTGVSNAVAISGVTIRDGSPTAPGGVIRGGGIFNEAALTLEGVVVAHNHADADGGSGQAGGTVEGGGIFSTGELQLANVQATENLASAVGATGKHGGVARGGGLVAAHVELDRVAFTGNVADARGGQGPPSPEQAGGFAAGGGLVAAPSGPPAMTAHGVLFAGNAVDASAGPGEGSGGSAVGGAAEVDPGGAEPTALSALTITGNSVLAAGGSSTAPGGFVVGGGLFVSSGSTAVASLVNSTIVGNSARAPGVGGGAEGGGMFGRSFKVPLEITSTTLNGNTVEAGGAGTGGGDLASFVLVSVSDTIVSAGIGPAGEENCTGTRESLGGNLDSRDQCSFHAAGDKVNADPLLGPPQENGGGLPTERPMTGSPAIDGGVASGCPATDERGASRPQGAACDIGAFETAPLLVTTLPPTEVTEHSAVLHGLASNPSVLPGGVFFQFGQRPGNFTGATVGLPNVGAGLVGMPSSILVTSLKPGTAYHYRFAAESPEGGAFGNEINFETTSPGPGSPGAPAPVLSGLALSPSSMRAERGHGASIAARKRRGAVLSYTDSIAALTTFTVQSVKQGFKVGRSCMSSRPRHVRGRPRRCTRLVKVGTFTHHDAGGVVRVRFTGRVGGRPLAPGSYRLSAVARSAAGRSSNALATGFKVIR